MPNKASKMAQNKPKKSEQVGFKVDPNLKAALLAAANEEDRPWNQLARMIFEWAWPIYIRKRSYSALKKTVIDYSGTPGVNDSDASPTRTLENIDEVHGTAKAVSNRIKSIDESRGVSDGAKGKGNSKDS